MANDDTVRGYAQALLSVAEAEGVLDRVQDELYAFAKAVERNGDLREALTDAALPPQRKKAVIDELLGERAHPTTATLVGFLVDAGQARRIGATGHPVELKIDVDPAVIGGVVARVGDEVFDGSLASRLTEAKQYLTGSV